MYNHSLRNMVTKEKRKAVSELKKGLAQFKEDALKKGWEEDEVNEKVSEVFQSKSSSMLFPIYIYKNV